MAGFAARHFDADVVSAVLRHMNGDPAGANLPTRLPALEAHSDPFEDRDHARPVA